MVAADDCVPNAVKYAGIMVSSMRNGLRRDTTPATAYWKSNRMICIAKITPIIPANAPSTDETSPSIVIFMKMPNIYNGKSGMMAFTMTYCTQSRNSSNPRRSAPADRRAMHIPMTKANTNAVITLISGGIATVK